MKIALKNIAIGGSLICNLASPAIAEISIFGISWDSPSIQLDLESKGYICTSKSTRGDADSTICNMQNNPESNDINAIEANEIGVEKRIIIFNTHGVAYMMCEVFNGCGHELVDIATNIIDSGIVPNMSLDEKYEETWTVLSKLTQSYCYEDPGNGDELCVIQESAVGYDNYGAYVNEKIDDPLIRLTRGVTGANSQMTFD